MVKAIMKVEVMTTGCNKTALMAITVTVKTSNNNSSTSNRIVTLLLSDSYYPGFSMMTCIFCVGGYLGGL